MKFFQGIREHYKDFERGIIMIVSYKDTLKMASITIISFCAVFVCTLFLNFNLDLADVADEITSPVSQSFYDAEVMTGKVVCGLSGGCLLLTTVVLLCFYVGHYIDIHQKELGILKALGYSRSSIAREFWIFGCSVLIGTATAYLCAHLLMPAFYEVQNADGFLPTFNVHFHPGLCSLLVFLPALFFSLLAVCYSYLKMKVSPLTLLRGKESGKIVKAKKDSDLPFLQELGKSNVRQRKSLVFFITFAVFCFSSMMQMSFSMDELSSKMMAVMIITIGIVLACVTLFLASTSVVKANGKTITMMKVFGYQSKDCAKAVLGGYRPWACFGFALGSIYQYLLLKIMVSIVFADVEGMPEYHFDFPAFLITLFCFVVLYESVMFRYTKKMEKMSIKEIMLE